MGFINKTNWTRKKHKNKKTSSSINEDELDKDDVYDIETSDNEANETPTKWYDEFPYIKLPKVDCDNNLVDSLKMEAEMILEEETSNYKTFLLECKNSERKWMMTMAKSGTSADKVAALTLMVQESPVHNLAALSSLINLAKVSKKHQFVLVVDTLTELFISDLLRPGKKLRKFHKQALMHLSDLCDADNKLRRKRLCYWLFEDKLKTLFEQFVKSLNDAAHDSVQNNREKAIGAMLKLLTANRESENVLINNLINKLGDPVHKVASRVVYGIEKVTQKYSKMKETILNEIERMLFRTNISKRAQYYGICLLSQYRLSGSDRELCKRLITLYFSFFKACVKTGDIDSRLMGALLVGVNRAYPYAVRRRKSESVIPEEHIDTMYKVVHLAPFKISLQALALLLQITNNDRFYNALYRKLLDKELIQTSHQAIWLNLMIKAIRKDPNENRKKSFVKRILQMCLYFPVPLLCGTLIMLSQIVKYLPDVANHFQFREDIEVKNEDPMMSDVISNLKKFEDEDEDEKVSDVKTEEEMDLNNKNETEMELKPSGGSSWFHRDLVVPKVDCLPSEKKKYKSVTAYDPQHRNPAFAGGEKATFVELVALARHFHPTVSLFATKILAGEKIHYSGDPLKDFTMLHFLERFSFKNPKKPRTDKGTDKEELFRAVGSERKHYNPIGMRALPVQSDLYLNQSESAVPVDELFLYRYLKERGVKEKQQKKQKICDSDDDSDFNDVESVGSVEFNEYMDTLMIGKKAANKLNFAEDVENTKKSHKGKKDNEDDDEDEDDDESDIEKEDINLNVDDEDDDDDVDEISENEEEMSIEDFEDENCDVDSDQDDEEEFDVSESENDEEEANMPLHNALRKRISRDFGNMAVPVEKFSEMLEEAGYSKSGGSHDVINRDNSSQKQIKWEASRVKQRWRSKNTSFDKGRRNLNRKENNHKWKKNNSKWKEESSGKREKKKFMPRKKK